MTSYTDRAEQIRSAQAARADDIRARRDLSAEGRRRQLAKIHTEARDAMKALRTEATAAAERRQQEIERHLFGNRDAGDHNAVTSFRNALEKANEIAGPEEAKKVLEVAAMSSDTALSRAVAARAYAAAKANPLDHGWGSVLDQYAAGDQRKDQLITELGELTRTTSTNARANGSVLVYNVPRPVGLSFSDDVDKLAADADADPSDDLGIHTGSRAGSWHDD